MTWIVEHIESQPAEGDVKEYFRLVCQLDRYHTLRNSTTFHDLSLSLTAMSVAIDQTTKYSEVPILPLQDINIC